MKNTEPLQQIKSWIDKKIESTPKYLSFTDYNDQNPNIWAEFEKTTLKLIKSGLKRVSSKAVFEIIRANSYLSNTGKYNINNVYSPDYARKFIKKYPEHNGVFEFRALKRSRTNN